MILGITVQNQKNIVNVVIIYIIHIVCMAMNPAIVHAETKYLYLDVYIVMHTKIKYVVVDSTKTKVKNIYLNTNSEIVMRIIIGIIVSLNSKKTPDHYYFNNDEFF